MDCAVDEGKQNFDHSYWPLCKGFSVIKMLIEKLKNMYSVTLWGKHFAGYLHVYYLLSLHNYLYKVDIIFPIVQKQKLGIKKVMIFSSSLIS